MVKSHGRFAAGAPRLLLLTVLVCAAPPLFGQVPPDESGRRPIDPETLEYVRESTDRDDADMRLPREYQPPPAAPPAAAPEPEAPAVVLWDNGPFVNCAGCGVLGADESVLQNDSLGMNTLGFGHQVAIGYWIADEFTVTDLAGWTIEKLFTFAYQTGSTAIPTMNEIKVLIWDGPPGEVGSSVIFGDPSTNRLKAANWTGAYRVTEVTTGLATSRPIMRLTAPLNVYLPQGTYWVTWSVGGTLPSGPWAPPLTFTGEATTGNGMQSTDDGVSYTLVTDSGSGTQQGFPFILQGQVGDAGPVAEIVLRKTAGLVPGTCAPTDRLTVAHGTLVVYCHEVTNVGNVELGLHDLVDSHLGTLLDDFPAPIPPGGNGFLTPEQVIETTTINVATWTAFNAGPTDVSSSTDEATVIVSPPEPLLCNGPAVGFELGIPADWRAINNAPGNPVVWSNLAGCGEAANYTSGSGDAACASSDFQGGGSGLYDTELVSPPVSLAGASGATLHYEANYQNFATIDFLEVDLSPDGGISWTTLLSWNEDHGGFRVQPGESVAIDLTPWIGPMPILLRWHYYDPDGPSTSQDWYAQIDDVSLVCDGLPPPGSCGDVTIAYKSYGTEELEACGWIRLGPAVTVNPDGVFRATSGTGIQVGNGVTFQGSVRLTIDPGLSP